MRVTEQKFGYDEKSGIFYDGTNSVVFTEKLISYFVSASILLYQKYYRNTPEECHLFGLFLSIREKACRFAAEKKSNIYLGIIFALSFIFPMLPNDTLLRRIESFFDIESKGEPREFDEICEIMASIFCYMNIASRRMQKIVNSFSAAEMHQKKSNKYKYMDKFEPIFEEILKEELKLSVSERNGRSSPFAHMFHEKIEPVLLSIPDLEAKKRDKNGDSESRTSWRTRQYKTMKKNYTIWCKNKPDIVNIERRLKNYFEKTLWGKFELCTDITLQDLPEEFAKDINQCKALEEKMERFLASFGNMP